MNYRAIYILAFSLGLAAVANAQLLVLSTEALERNRNAVRDHEARLEPSVKDLRKKADQLVAAGRLYSVIDKTQVPPSGDKHDYMSQGPYWWPDPSKPKGLPYIRRDGEQNPEIKTLSDAAAMDDMVGDSETLALAYFFIGDEKYAKHSSALIRTWFLDPKTRQNPNLNFGQGIPGISSGRGIGLIETRDLYRVIDAATLLERSGSWTKADQDRLKRWFAEFLKWMTTSPLGIDEADAPNNHGTYYDVQILSYAIYTGQKDLARKQIETSRARIRSQIEPDGHQPHELARTLSWDYTNMNLLGFFTIARLAEHLGVDLWNFEIDGRGIRKAFLWELPYLRDEKVWPYKQIKERKFSNSIAILRIAARKFGNPDHSRLADKLASIHGKGAFSLLTY